MMKRPREPRLTESQNLMDSAEKNSHIPGKSLRSKINNYWIYEVISCIGSIGALLGIVGVLRAYDRKPLPDWPWGITINSVLSWLSQIYNALTLANVASCIGQSKWVMFARSQHKLADFNSFDSASRGVLGSIAFLWSATHLTSVSSPPWLRIVPRLSFLDNMFLSGLSLRLLRLVSDHLSSRCRQFRINWSHPIFLRRFLGHNHTLCRIIVILLRVESTIHLELIS